MSRVETFLISVLVFVLIVTSATYILTDARDNYNLTLNDTQLGVFNKTDNLNELGEDFREAIVEAQIDTGTDTFSAMVKAGVTALRLLFTAPANIFAMSFALLNEIAIIFSIPSFLIALVVTAISLIFVFGIIYLVLRSRG